MFNKPTLIFQPLRRLLIWKKKSTKKITCVAENSWLHLLKFDVSENA